MRNRLLFALLAAAFASSLFSAPAYAQRARTFVASYGNDSNPCSFGSPCRNFQQAVNVVAAGGEVTAIDSAGFGPILITKAVAITSPNGVEAGIVPVSGGNSITINAGPFDAITLSGLVIDGAGVGANGVGFADGGYLIMQDCVIRNMTGDGIHFVSNFISHLSVTNTFVGNNLGHGILVQPTGEASVTAVFERVRTQYNSSLHPSFGIALDGHGTAGFITGTATDTVSSDNEGGFFAGQNASMLVVRSVVANNGIGALSSSGSVIFAQSTINNNVSACSGSTLTYGDNYVLNSHVDGCATPPFLKE